MILNYHWAVKRDDKHPHWYIIRNYFDQYLTWVDMWTWLGYDGTFLTSPFNDKKAKCGHNGADNIDDFKVPVLELSIEETLFLIEKLGEHV